MKLDFINIAHAGVITDAPTFQNIGINILSFLLWIAGIIAIIALVISGIRYFFSFGDEAKMEIAKKSTEYAIVGIILVAGSMVLVRMIGQFFQ
jgi:hypothetical protein